MLDEIFLLMGILLTVLGIATTLSGDMSGLVILLAGIFFIWFYVETHKWQGE